MDCLPDRSLRRFPAPLAGSGADDLGPDVIVPHESFGFLSEPFAKSSTFRLKRLKCLVPIFPRFFSVSLFLFFCLVCLNHKTQDG